MNIPQGICLSTLKTFRGTGYSPAGRRNLWSGAKVSAMLPFDRSAFQSFRAENSERMSISGIQEKISLRLEGNVLAPATSDGTYLLKPVPFAMADALELAEDVPANEHVTMQIAAQVFQINTAACGIVLFPDGERALAVRRFDWRDGRKLRQEDFCQLSGRSARINGQNFKYDGSYEECGGLLRSFCPAWRVAIERLFRQIVFNYIIGNGDAHLKNFSLLETPSGDHALSPAYDLLCTSLHLPNESRMALDLFRDDFETPFFQANGFYGCPDFMELAARFGIEAGFAGSIINSFIEKQADVREFIARSLLTDAAKHRFLNIFNDRLRALRS